MNKKSGTAGTPVEPVEVKVAEEADVADPGQVAEIKAEQIETKSGKYGSVKAKPYKPSEEAGSEESASKSWIEIELVGEDDKAIPGERYEITLPDGKMAGGTLDQNGWARVEGFEAGGCKVTFPDLDAEAWEFVKSAGPRSKEIT